jgi:hypothetical protein
MRVALLPILLAAVCAAGTTVGIWEMDEQLNRYRSHTGRKEDK